MAPRPTQVPYFRKLADYLRADLKSDDPTRQQGALERIRSALPATQPMSDEDVRSSFRHGDALDVIAVEQRAPDWRRFTAGEPGGAADDAAETVNEFLAWVRTRGAGGRYYFPNEMVPNGFAVKDWLAWRKTATVPGGREEMIFLTNALCENAHGSRALLAKYGLPWSVFDSWDGHHAPKDMTPVVPNGVDDDERIADDREFYPLTPLEANFIADESIDVRRGYSALMGYSVLLDGLKWIAPTIEFYFGPTNAAPDRVPNEESRRRALLDMADQINDIRTEVHALGGRLVDEMDMDDRRHALHILLPPGRLSATFGRYENYRLWLEKLLAREP